MPADQTRLHTPDRTLLLPHAEKASGCDRFVGTLDPDKLGFAEIRRSINQSSGGLADEHPARRSDGLHPLRHTDLLSDRGVTD